MEKVFHENSQLLDRNSPPSRGYSGDIDMGIPGGAFVVPPSLIIIFSLDLPLRRNSLTIQAALGWFMPKMNL